MTTPRADAPTPEQIESARALVEHWYSIHEPSLSTQARADLVERIAGAIAARVRDLEADPMRHPAVKVFLVDALKYSRLGPGSVRQYAMTQSRDRIPPAVLASLAGKEE